MPKEEDEQDETQPADPEAQLPSEDLGGYEPPSEHPEILPPATNGRPRDIPDAELSGSQFDAGSQLDAEEEDLFSEDGQPDKPPPRTTPKGKGKRTVVADSDDDFDALAIPEEDYVSRSGRSTKRKILMDDSEEDEYGAPPRKTALKKPRRRNSNNDFVAHDEEDDETDLEADYGSRRITTKNRDLINRKAKRAREEEEQRRRLAAQANKSFRRNTRNSRATVEDTENEAYIPEEEDDEDRQYSFRARKKQVNYILPTLEQINAEAAKNLNTRRDRTDFIKPKKQKGLPFSMSGRQLDALFGNKPETSDDDATPRKRGPFGPPGMFGGTGGMLSGGGMDLSGTPGNFGRVGGSELSLSLFLLSLADNRLQIWQTLIHCHQLIQ